MRFFYVLRVVIPVDGHELVSIHKSPISVSRGAIGRSPVPYPDTCVDQISGDSSSSNYNVVIGSSFRNTSP